MDCSGWLLSLGVALAGMADAATFTAGETADLPDLIPGNGYCNVFPQAGPGPCTLRAAIIEANALPGADTIVLVAGAHYDLTLAGAGEDGGYTGDLDITDDLQIRFLASGGRPRVFGTGDDRVFDVISGSVTLLGFDIAGGDATGTLATSGGGVLVRSTAGHVGLALMRVYQNFANLGGGMYNFGGDTVVDDSEFASNSFIGDTTETPSGSAIRNRGTLTIRHSSFFYNTGYPITGIAGLAGIDGTTFEANTIDNQPQGANSGNLAISNSTLVMNSGTAIAMEGAGEITLSNVTVGGNTTSGIQLSGDGGRLVMRNSVIAEDGAFDCDLAAGADLDVDHYNLDSDNSCALASGATNYAGVEPYLTPPARHGGFTFVSWPLTSSPLLESGDVLVGPPGCETDDQSFTARPVDFDGDGTARCDIGAVELDDDVIFFDPFDRLMVSAFVTP